MWPDRASNLGPLAYESDALPTALRGPVILNCKKTKINHPLYLRIIIIILYLRL